MNHPKKSIRIALAQMEVITGQPSRNLGVMREMVESSKSAGAELVVFPAYCLGGYPYASKFDDPEYREFLESFNDEVLALSSGIGILFGNHDSESDFDALFALDGKWVESEYDLDARRFIFELAGSCWDVVVDVSQMLFGDLPPIFPYDADYCDFAIELCAEPWVIDEFGSNPMADNELLTVRVNSVGMQNTGKNVMAFDGGSGVYFPGGDVAYAMRDDFMGQLGICTISLDEDEIAVEGDDLDEHVYEDVDEKTLDALVATLKRFDQQVFPFKPKWIIGLSGGLDSSVTAALLGLALEDSSRIIGYNLATRYNSDATKMNAYGLAQALGIKLVNGSIEDIVAATTTVMGLYGYPPEDISGLAQENIQARLRGHMLSTFAAVEGGVIMNNGNKVEVALGYATLYGDAIGALAPIGDMTKVRLFRLARCINRRYGKEVVPENLLPTETPDGFDWQTMPSAELRDAQRDPMKWFYHDWVISRLLGSPRITAEELMDEYLKSRLLDSEVSKWIRYYGLDDPQAFIEDLEWVLKQFNGSAFKRVQAPPSITITRGAFGTEYYEVQGSFEMTSRYRDLKERILALD